MVYASVIRYGLQATCFAIRCRQRMLLLPLWLGVPLLLALDLAVRLVHPHAVKLETRRHHSDVRVFLRDGDGPWQARTVTPFWRVAPAPVKPRRHAWPRSTHSGRTRPP